MLVSTLDDLCTPPAVAELLHISRPTVYAALRRKRGLEHLRTPGGQIRIRRRDVLAYCHAAGLAVPSGLVPRPVDLVMLHPDSGRVAAVRSALEPHCRVHGYAHPVDGLIALGRVRPPLALVSLQMGQEVVDRLCRGLYEVPGGDYAALVVLAPGQPRRWAGGSLPRPLPLAEPEAEGMAWLVEIVENLLGLG